VRGDWQIAVGGGTVGVPREVPAGCHWGAWSVRMCRPQQNIVSDLVNVKNLGVICAYVELVGL
jgi:hypothetical protein